MIRSAYLVFLLFLAGGSKLRAQESSLRYPTEIWRQKKLCTVLETAKECGERETGIIKRLFGDTRALTRIIHRSGLGDVLTVPGDTSELDMPTWLRVSHHLFSTSYPGYLALDAPEEAGDVVRGKSSQGPGTFGVIGSSSAGSPIRFVRNGWQHFGDADWLGDGDTDSSESHPLVPRGDFDFRGLPGAPAGDFEFREDVKI
jgi:hypothetical protein